jgi:hypothetical protein
MKALEAVNYADELCPNQYTAEQKQAWLADFEVKVLQELILTHEDEHAEEYSAIDRAEGNDFELIIPAPYARDVYVNFLLSKIAEANVEIERYNLHASAFNAGYGQFCSWYNRTHLPLPWKGWRY